LDALTRRSFDMPSEAAETPDGFQYPNFP
jgi:hypothetical protein